MIAPRAWLPKLILFCEIIRQDEIRTVEALLVKTCGDFVAGMVLYRLLLWLPHGKRKDGGIWKKDADWNAELGLSYAQMSRVREILAPMVRTQVRKAQGAPTCHYWLDAEGLIGAIAGVVGCSDTLARMLIFDKVENGFSTNSKMDSQESRKSITTIPTTIHKQTETNDVVVVDETIQSKKDFAFTNSTPTVQALMGIGVARRLAEQYGELDIDAVRALIADAQTKKQNREIKKSVAAYVVGALQMGVQVPAALPAPPATDNRFPETPEQELIDPLPKGAPSWAEITPAPDRDSPEGKWQTFMEQVELQIDKGTWTTWCADMQFVAVFDGAYIASVRNEKAREMLQYGRMYRTLTRILRDITLEDLQLVFEVRE